MRTYTITRKSAPVAWEAVPALPIDIALWGTETDVKAQAQVCYDDAALHVRLVAVEKNIRAEEDGLLGEPSDDSCLEFFFSPDPADARYFNVEFNPNGCVYLGFGSDRYNLVRFIPEQPCIHPVISWTEDGWELRYSIPFTFIRQFFPNFAPVSGGSICANFYKCGDQTPKRHYLCWNEVASVKPDFHLREYFGTLYFE